MWTVNVAQLNVRKDTGSFGCLCGRWDIHVPDVPRRLRRPHKNAGGNMSQTVHCSRSSRCLVWWRSRRRRLCWRQRQVVLHQTDEVSLSESVGRGPMTELAAVGAYAYSVLAKTACGCNCCHRNGVGTSLFCCLEDVAALKVTLGFPYFVGPAFSSPAFSTPVI